MAELYITPPNGSETCFERTPASGTGSYTQYIYTDNKYTFSQSGTYQYRWHISYAGNTKSVDYSGVFQIESDTVKLNINGYLDGKETGSLEGYGTADVYINGSQVASNVNDYYGNVPIGATYEVKNIVYAQGYLYHGVKSGALTGTVGTSEAKILLNFRKNIDIGTNFYARIISKALNMALTNTDDRDVVGQMVDASDAQIWYFERQSDGFYKIRSAKDERYLDVYSVSNVAESNVHVHDDGDYSSMLWAVHTTSESGVYLFGVKSTESLLDINGATKNIHVYPDIDANTQLFTIQKLGNLMVTLNPCDGNVSPTSISVTYGEPYGNLPTPTLTGYTFAGWYTAESGGTQVMPSTKVTTAGNHTLYAHWTLDYVSVTGITLSKTAFTLTAGDSETLISTVTPDNATNKDVTWTTSDTSVATVSNGKVTAVGAGSATITVTTVDGGKTATCNVTVQQDTPASDAMLVSIENKTAAAGKTVDLAIKIENNPGIAMTQFKVTYDAALTLESADVGDVFSQSELTPGAVGNNPYTIMFYNTSANRTDDGTLAVLHFRVSDTAEEDSAHSVSISGIASGIDENKVPIVFVDGSVTSRSIVFGDVNGDGDVNGLDVLRLGKYLTGWDVSVDEAAADVNVDGEINGLDQLRLAKYCAGWPVTLGN